MIKAERRERNLLPLHGVESNISSVALSYATYLLENDKWGHSADGRSPWERLEANPAIQACHAILWYPYNDNSGPTGQEGFLGIGRASGGPYQGPFQQPWNYAELIVMNVFDPCANWDYDLPPVSDWIFLLIVVRH